VHGATDGGTGFARVEHDRFVAVTQAHDGRRDLQLEQRTSCHQPKSGIWNDPETEERWSHNSLTSLRFFANLVKCGAVGNHDPSTICKRISQVICGF
jgi:hypothetical protein